MRAEEWAQALWDETDLCGSNWLPAIADAFRRAMSEARKDGLQRAAALFDDEAQRAMAEAKEIEESGSYFGPTVYNRRARAADRAAIAVRIRHLIPAADGPEAPEGPQAVKSEQP